jgi:RNA polymerase sigma factor (TIGR02999 family)
MIRQSPEFARHLSSCTEHTTHQFFEEVYEELRNAAARLMHRERVEHTLSATALVNESYLRIMAGHCETWDSRAHFLSAAAESMRRILIDAARARNCQKRAGRRQQLDLQQVLDSTLDDDGFLRILELDDQIERLSEDDPLAAEFVKLRVYSGCNVIDAGTARLEQMASLSNVGVRAALVRHGRPVKNFRFWNIFCRNS